MGYTCSSAVFDFGKGREAPQHARRSLWRFIFRGFLTSNDCEDDEQMSVESVERYISLEHLNACESEVPVCIEHSVCMEIPDLFSDIADSNSAIILTSLRPQSS